MNVIAVKCACGNAMKFAADKAGRKAKCPKCETILTVPKPEANGAAAAAAPNEDEGDGLYGVVVDKDLEERRRQIEEQDRIRLKELKKKKKPKVQKKFKNLPDAEQWEKVHFGVLFLVLGACVWAFSHLLQGMWVALGTVEHKDYAHLVTMLIDGQNPLIPERGEFWQFSQYHLLVAMAAGNGFAIFAKVCLAINLILYPIQALLWIVGCILCLPVPRHHGTLGLLISIMVLGGFNLLAYLFFRLLPTTGIYQYYLIPYFMPELLTVEYNMDRVYPFFMLYSPSPFFESLLSFFLMFLYYLQPILGCCFVWSCGTILKDKPLEEQAGAVAATGFGQFLAWLALLLIALCGTSAVLVTTLRVLYIAWYSFLMMFMIRYAMLNWRLREVLDTRLNPES